MDFKSPWTSQLKKRDPISCNFQDLPEIDTLVVGAGIAGVSTAYFILKNTNKNVLLLDAHLIGHGATGHNAGQVVAEFERHITDIAHDFGEDVALDAYNSVESAWVDIRKIIHETKIDVDLQEFTGYVGFSGSVVLKDYLADEYLFYKNGYRRGRFYIASDSSELEAMKKLYEPLLDIVPRSEILQKLETIDDSYDAVLENYRGLTNSALFCEELVKYMQKNFHGRFFVSETSPVDEIYINNDNAVSNLASSFSIKSKHVVLCTNGFEKIKLIKNNDKTLNTKFHYMVSGFVGYMAGYLEKIKHNPVTFSYIQKSSHKKRYIEPYYYITKRDFPCDSAMGTLTCLGGPEFSMSDTRKYHKDTHVYSKKALDSTRKFIKKTYAKDLGRDDFDFLWHGLMGYTPTKIRCVGFDPSTSVLMYNLGCNGVGILSSIFGAKRISLLLAGKVFPHSLFDPFMNISKMNEIRKKYSTYFDL